MPENIKSGANTTIATKNSIFILIKLIKKYLYKLSDYVESN